MHCFEQRFSGTTSRARTPTSYCGLSRYFRNCCYPVHLAGGTGKFSQVTGDFNNIGEVDLNSGQIVLRYSGQLCSPKNN